MTKTTGPHKMAEYVIKMKTGWAFLPEIFFHTLAKISLKCDSALLKNIPQHHVDKKSLSRQNMPCKKLYNFLKL